MSSDDATQFTHCRAVGPGGATQWAKFAKKVNKPPLGVNVINFELNRFNASIWVPKKS